MSKLNFVLLVAAVCSAFAVIDLRSDIAHQTNLLGKGMKQSIRLNQDKLTVQYEHSKATDLNLIVGAAVKMNMHLPKQEALPDKSVAAVPKTK